ncbi:hypothetical protein LPJ81_005878, partial [Coemansia sp. IMI 209127]
GRSTAARSPSSRWGQNHSESEGHRYRRDERSRSGGRSRGNEYARRSGDHDPASHGGASPRRGTYRDDEGDYRRSGSYRPTGGGRYGDRDYGRPGYSRQYEREPTPRYRRRDSERQPYARAPGYLSRDEAVDEFGDRRDVDKDRAIEELRSRVRGVRPPSHERSSPASQASAPAQGSGEDAVPQSVKPSEQPTAAVDENDSKDVDMDDLEEGEHIEGEIEIEAARVATPEYRPDAAQPLGRRSSSYGRTREPPAGRSRSRVRDSRERSRSREYDRAYRRDYARDSDSAYPRRRYDEYRTRDVHAGRPGYYSRYTGDRSPEARDSTYRPERRYQGSPGRPRSRSRSPVYVRDGDDDRRGRAAYSHRYRAESRPASPRGVRSYSRSPRHGDQRWHGRDMYRSPSRQLRGGADLEATEMSSDANALPPPPPPPPPPMVHSSSVHSQPPSMPLPGDGARASPPPYHDSPYRGGYSSRSYRRDPRTPRGGGSYDYSGHSRDPSAGGYHAGHNASRGHSPGAAGSRYGVGNEALPPPPPPPPLPVEQPLFPEYKYGTDLHVSRHVEPAEWLEARQQLRDHTRRVLEVSAAARKTAFELSYAKWGVLKTDSLVQLAA